MTKNSGKTPKNKKEMVKKVEQKKEEENKFDGYITINTTNEEKEDNISYEEALQMMMEGSTRMQEVAKKVLNNHRQGLDKLLEITEAERTRQQNLLNGITPILENLMQGIGEGISEKLGLLSKRVLENIAKPLIEQANLFHKRWIEELAKIDDENEIKEQIKESIYQIGNPFLELEKEMEQEEISEDEKERRREELKKSLQEMEEEYYNEVLEEKKNKEQKDLISELVKIPDDEIIQEQIHDFLYNKKDPFFELEKEMVKQNLSEKEQKEKIEKLKKKLLNDEEELFKEVVLAKRNLRGLTTEETQDLKQIIENIRNPKTTAYITGNNVSGLFSQEGEIEKDKSLVLAKSKPKTREIYTEDGPSLEETAYFIIEYVFKNGLAEGEFTLKEREVFENVIYFSLMFSKINKSYNKIKEDIPTIIPENILAKMNKGDPSKVIQRADREFSRQVMEKFERSKVRINYEELKKQFKMMNNKELPIKDTQMIGKEEYPSFVSSTYHKGINWKKEFEKHGIIFSENDNEFDGYVIDKIPILPLLELDGEIEFLPIQSNSYLSHNTTGIAIKTEFNSLFTSLNKYRRKQRQEAVEKACSKYPIDSKGKELKNWQEKMKDEEWKKKNIASWRYQIEEKIDTFFEHCYNLAKAEPEEAQKFGHYEGENFIPIGKETPSIASNRRKRSGHIERMNDFLYKAKEDGMIIDYCFIGKDIKGNERKIEIGKNTKHKLPVYKVVIMKGPKTQQERKRQAIKRIN